MPAFAGADIALLKLSKKIEFNYAVQPIDLPNQEDDIQDTDDLEVAGWGQTADQADYWMKDTLPKKATKTLLKLKQTYRPCQYYFFAWFCDLFYNEQLWTFNYPLSNYQLNHYPRVSYFKNYSSYLNT